MSRLRERPLVVAGLYLAALALLFTGPALLGRVSLGPDVVLDGDSLYRIGTPPSPRLNDQTRSLVDLPRDLTFAGELWSGRLSLWNPLSACGAPLWAEQGGPFFPLKLPFYLAPSVATYELFVTLRLIFEALGAYLLGRRRGLSPGGALAAAAAYELSGATVPLLAFGAASPVCMLPWVLLGAEAIGRRPSAGAAAGSAIALGVTGHGGHPTLILLVFSAFAVSIAGHMALSLRRPRRLLEIAACALAAALLGLLLAAPALLPLAELATQGTSYKEHGMGRFFWKVFLDNTRDTLPYALFAPGLLRGFDELLGNDLLFGATIGATGLVLALVGIARRGLDPPLAGVGLLGVVLATAPPGLAWVGALPGLKLILPCYAWPLTTLALTQALGRGAEALAAPGGRRAAWTAFLVLPAGLLLLVLLPHRGGGLFRPNLSGHLRFLLESRGGLALFLAPPAFAAATLALYFAARRTRLRGASLPLLVVLLSLELYAVMAPLAWHPASEVLSAPPPPAVRFLQRTLAGGDRRMIGTPFRVGHPLSPMLFRLPDMRGLSPLPIVRYRSYLEDISRKSVSLTVSLGDRLSASPSLDLAAVGPVVVSRPDGAPPAHLRDDPEMPLVYSDAEVLIYENRAALPRVRIVRRAERGPGPDWARRRLRVLAGRARHVWETPLAETVLIEPDSEGRFPPRTGGAGHAGDYARIADQSDPDRLVIEARLAKRGLVVVADTYYPGWTATVDGEPASIHPADLLFRAVPVPAGEHTVEMRYEPRSFRYGVFLFLFAAACVVGLLVLPIRNCFHHGEHEGRE